MRAAQIFKSAAIRGLLLGLAVAAHAAPNRPLPSHELTPAEQQFIRDHYDEYLEQKLTVPAGRAPTNLMAAPAEFDRADGVIFAYVQYQSLVRQLIHETAKNAHAWVTVYGDSEEQSARREFVADGTNMENVSFVHADIDSVWMRDYGPWWIQTADGDREIIDLIYNRPRPNDDKFPSVFAQQQGLKAHTTKLILPGGNLILDGHGMAIMTDQVFDASQGENSHMSMDELKSLMKELFGVDKVILLKAMKRDGTGHADMFCKMLNDTTVIVGEYAKPGDGASNNFEILNDNAAKLAQETNGSGSPLKVFRIPMPRYTGRSYTYTNSLIVNDKVLVPVYGFASDNQALDVYRKLMPGATVVGFDCNSIIGANGAIHCITKLVMTDPFTVTHKPPRGSDEGVSTPITATIESEQPVDPNKVQLFYRAGTGGDWQSTPMAQREGKEWAAQLPAFTAGTTVQYYIRAEDVRGMYETSPDHQSDANVHSLSVHAHQAE